MDTQTGRTSAPSGRAHGHADERATSGYDERRVWRSFSRASALLREVLGREVEARSGLSLNEFEILERLVAAPSAAVRMAALAEDLVHSRSRLTHAVHRMESRGLVERRACEADGRGVFCALTPLGARTYADVEPRYRQALLDHLHDRLSPDEVDVLVRVTGRIADELGAEPLGIAWVAERAG